MSKASRLYLQRKKLVPDLLYPRPWFATNSLPSHRRPHVTLPALRDIENPGARLETRPIEETPAHACTDCSE